MSQPSAFAAFPPPPAPGPPPPVARRELIGLAITALVLGIISASGSPIPILNNVTVVAGFIGIAFGVAGLFGAHRVMSAAGLVLAIAGVVVGLILQAQWTERLDKLKNDLDRLTAPNPPAFSTRPRPPTASDMPTVPAMPSLPAVPSKPRNPDANERGNVPKKLGDEVAIGSAKFVVDKIDIDPKCGKYMPKRPAGKHSVVLHVRVTTGPDEAANRDLGAVLSPYGVKTIGSDGVTVNSMGGSCADISGVLPPSIGPNQRAQGTVDVETTAPHGILILQGYGETGWEYSY
ncbi:hypothetical protein [Amycolatopsis sp. CA-230715]|uniref:hypothetical protein n=1 Tax=Amycolatopsis sp. CA-230715 TaxID=2745196 RepID=UPI001C039D79|nr:hypothetical protein [Amycolatopsis sp. CA-230715]QWF76932.1 hypothetical protein HUW46_00312 [Amycolatopsis sp. CA-230715]